MNLFFDYAFKGSLLLIVLLSMTLSVTRVHASENMNLFMPTSGWLVGPSQVISHENDKNPCIIMNQFNKGFLLRISGLEDKILAMALDFRQGVFNPNSKYDVKLEIMGTEFSKEVVANAFDKGTLLINTKNQDQLFQALSNGKALNLTIKNRTLSFLLIGLDEGLGRMNQCVNNKVTPASSHVKKSDMSGMNLSSQNNMPQSQPSKKQLSNETKKNYASEIAQKFSNNDFTATMQNDPELMNELLDKLNAIEPAAGYINSEISSSNASENNYQQAASEWKPPSKNNTLGKKKDIIVNSNEKQYSNKSKYQSVRKWRAMKGANLREVLHIWSEHAGVRLIWLAGADFSVQESMSYNGTFHQAIIHLFEQYIDARARPVGKIYDEPSSSGKALMVEMHTN